MENKDDPKKFFNPDDYVTKIISGEEDQVPATKKGKVSTLIALLTDPENKDVKEETLLTLKKEKAGQLLIDALKQVKSAEKKAVLAAACWESEIDFSKDLSFFVDLACDKEYLVSLEAITVIDTMEGPFNKSDVLGAIKKVKAEQKKLDNERVVLLNDLAVKLEGFGKKSE
jgi:hypothetical protein